MKRLDETDNLEIVGLEQIWANNDLRLDLTTTQNHQVQVIFLNLMASGGIYSSIYITIHSIIHYLCALDTTLRVLVDT